MQASRRLPFYGFDHHFDVQFDVLISSTVYLAERSNELLHFRDWLPPARTSLSVTEMKLLLDDGCPVRLIPVSRGQVPIATYCINSSRPIQNLGLGGVVPRICDTFSQHGPLGTLICCSVFLAYIHHHVLDYEYHEASFS